jgi:hypothetical protein
MTSSTELISSFEADKGMGAKGGRGAEGAGAKLSLLANKWLSGSLSPQGLSVAAVAAGVAGLQLGSPKATAACGTELALALPNNDG